MCRSRGREFHAEHAGDAEDTKTAPFDKLRAGSFDKLRAGSFGKLRAGCEH